MRCSLRAHAGIGCLWESRCHDVVPFADFAVIYVCVCVRVCVCVCVCAYIDISVCTSIDIYIDVY